MAIYRRTQGLLATTAICTFLFINYVDRNKNSTEMVHYVNFRNPPPCSDALREAIRFNELIAYTQYNCPTKQRIPDEAHAFQLCLDPTNGVDVSDSNFVFVTVSNFEDFDFETELFRISNGSGLILTPKNQDGPDSLNHRRIVFHHGVLVPSDSTDRGDDSRKYLIASDFRDYVARFEKIDVFKLDCTNCWRLSDNPKLLLELIELKMLNKVKQLHLVVRLEENAQGLLHSWYSLLHKLYYESGFALYSAVQLGECGRTVVHCQYKLSFVKVPGGGATNILAPINGMGFPEEEISRLLSTINDHSDKCPAGNQMVWQLGNKLWTFCDIFPSGKELKIYYFTYNATSLSASTLDKHRRMFMFDPTLSEEQVSRRSSRNIRWMSLTLADIKFGNLAPGLSPMQTEWQLSTLSQIMRDLKHSDIDFLILDLNGGEWDVFDEILSKRLTKNFRQMAVKLRIWFGEENENYRQLYSWIVRLEGAGWTMLRFGCDASHEDDACDSCGRGGCYVLNFFRI